MPLISRDEQELLRQANRRLTLMSKRQESDANVSRAMEFAKEDIRIHSSGQANRFAVTENMTDRQARAMVRAAEQLIASPYSNKKETEKLYNRQVSQFAQNYSLTKKQAKELINLFDKKKNPEVADAWEKIRDTTTYQAAVPFLKDENKMADLVQNIGPKKFGLMLRLYKESGLIGEQNLAQFLSDKEYTSFFANNSTETLEKFVNEKMWE